LFLFCFASGFVVRSQNGVSCYGRTVPTLRRPALTIQAKTRFSAPGRESAVLILPREENAMATAKRKDPTAV
jgi:hypothetical protein